jgi:hypothetical protein
MANLSKIIRCWGIIDLSYIFFDVVRGAPRAHTLFYYQIKYSFKSAVTTGNYFPMARSLLAILLFLSLIISGYLLIKLKKQGAIIVYLQTPLRIFLVEPSLFFIFWPAPYLLANASVNINIFLIVAILTSECFKLLSMFYWHRSLRNAV